MAKKQTYYAIAEKTYVEQHIPISGIAKRLDITEKTLGDWKKEGNWDAKKSQLLQSQQSCNAELYELVRKMTKKISEDYAKDITPDAGTLYFLKGMIDKLPKLKAYEESNIVKEQENKASTEELLSKVSDILGI